MIPLESKKQKSFFYWFSSILIALIVNILPAYGVYTARTRIDPTHIAIYLTIISLLTVHAYWSDKQKAQQKVWRTPESTLHLFELAGGWIAAFFAQRLFWHKIAKSKYQIVFWAIVALHNYIAFDFLSDWHYTKMLADFIETSQRRH